MEEYKIDCLKSENKRLNQKIKELEKKKKTPLVFLGIELGVLICQIITLISLIIVK